MYLGTQHISGDAWERFEVLPQLGVHHVCADPPGSWREWTAGSVAAYGERLASMGLSLDIVPLPLGSGPAHTQGLPHLFLKPTPERDRELDQVCDLIRVLAQAGISMTKYNITILGHIRTPSRAGRGGSGLSSFEYSRLNQSVDDFEDGPADADEMWERISTFLDRVVPVAEEYRVRLACHPQDPGIGERTYRGVARVLGTVEGLKRLVSIRESPYHGLNFCQGTISEMLERPGEEICGVIRDFGLRKKIFNVHFRNIRGGVMDFVEVLPDDGDVDMIEALRAYQEVGYEYMIMPDHVPGISGPAPGDVAFGYSFGYVRAAMQALSIQDDASR